MIFIESELKGVFVIRPERIPDERGFFARTFCRDEFISHGLNPSCQQQSISYNPNKGTLRGMHYQEVPHGEDKLVRCTSGAVFDVVIDLRRGSDTFTRWLSVELTADNRDMLYIPKGFAHGFLTLIGNTEVSYQMSEPYRPEYSRGVRWNDPVFGISWPHQVSVISEKDGMLPDFRP